MNVSDEERYNGWANYETSCVAQWVATNDRLYELIMELAKDRYLSSMPKTICDNGIPVTFSRREVAVSRMSFDILNKVREFSLCANLEYPFNCLVLSSLNRVDYLEVSEYWISAMLQANPALVDENVMNPS